MVFIDEIIGSKNLSTSTKAMYRKAIGKLGVTNPDQLNDINSIVKSINKYFESDESKKIVYNAICKVLEGLGSYDHYNNLRNEIKRKIEYDKSNNVGQLPMTMVELMNSPNLVKNKDPKRELIDKFFIYMHVKYPLRLDYCNVRINPIEKTGNYMTFDGNILTFYLNDFKTVKSMGKQIITYNDPIIVSYFDNVAKYVPRQEYLLYQNDFDIFKSRGAFGNHLTYLFQKYTGKHVTNNDIRKIHETNTINSEGYNNLTNRQKNALHGKLLHRAVTANNAYNIINKK